MIASYIEICQALLGIKILQQTEIHHRLEVDTVMTQCQNLPFVRNLLLEHSMESFLNELKRMKKDDGKNTVTAAQAFKDIDTNSDGKLSYEEFSRWYNTTDSSKEKKSMLVVPSSLENVSKIFFENIFVDLREEKRLKSAMKESEKSLRFKPVSYTHLTLPTNSRV